MIDFNSESDKTFELNLLVRDSEGQPTGKRKSFSTDDSNALWEFHMRHQGRPKKRKKFLNKKDKNKRRGVLPDAKKADQILRNMYKDKDNKDE